MAKDKSLNSPAAASNSNNKSTPEQNKQNNKSGKPVNVAFLVEQIEKQNKEITLLKNFADAQAKHIVQIEENYAALINRVRKNERSLEINESVSIVKDRVICELKEQLNRQEQFMRRPCVSISGIPKKHNESFQDLKGKIESLLAKTNGDVTVADVDKFHRDGQQFGDRQDVIVRFLSHSAKEVFYDKRKAIAGDNEQLKIRPNLTDGTKQLLKDANDFIRTTTYESYGTLSNPPQFALPDVHGNLMVLMKKPSRFGRFIKFRNMESFRARIGMAQGDDDDGYDQLFDEYDNMNDDHSGFGM